MATAATPNQYTTDFANDIAQEVAAQLATAASVTATSEESNSRAANGTYETTSTVNSFQTALDQYSLLKADAEDGQLTSPTLTDPTLLGTTFATTPVRGATDNKIATAEFVAQAITDTLTGLGSIVPIGTIAMWSGTLEDTPAGWQVCDGTNDTPDLRGRFVLGANSTITAGTTGGTANAVVVDHTHTTTVTDPGHAHGITDPGHAHTHSSSYGVSTYTMGDGNIDGSAHATGYDRETVSQSISSNTTGVTVNSNTTGVSVSVASTGESGTNKNLPPYYALYYIMKLADVVTPPTTAPLYVDTTNARIGINVANPTVALDVSGASKLTGAVNVTGALTVSTGLTTMFTANATGNTQLASLGIGTAASGTAGEIRATNNITAYYSDDRFKTRLGNIENALDKIDQLTGFYYEANELAQSYGYEKVREVGVSAQDTQKVFGEIVAPAPIDERYLTVRYEKFAPLLIEGIKELRSEINKIKDHLKI